VPFDPALKLHSVLKREAMAQGLLCYPFGGTVDGKQGDHVLLAPPFIASTADLAEITRRLVSSIDAVTQPKDSPTAP
jgi:adenosylmethionine-8-amino-7-oxononanoate aminotransferase